MQVDKTPATLNLQPKAGQLIQVKLTKVSAEAIKGDYIGPCLKGELDSAAELAQSVFDSV